jgi:protein-disulfide isomerase
MFYDRKSARKSLSGEVTRLPSIRSCSFSLVLIFAAECLAQTAPLPTPVGPSTSRQIEVFIRSQFSVPPGYDIQLGASTQSEVPGYNNVPVTLTFQGKQTTINFLVSKDGKMLARLEKFDVGNNPAFAIDVGNRPIRGNPASRVEIVNFDDLECPFCAYMNSELSQQTLDHYKGLIKIVYKDYPLEEIHPWAMHAAVDANCLADLNDKAYWAYVDYVHSHTKEITGATLDPARSFRALDDIAGKIVIEDKIQSPKLEACLQKQDESVVKQSLKLGDSLHFEATPQVFVSGERLPSGARPIEELWPAIDRALKDQGIQPPPEPSPASASDSGKSEHRPDPAQ